MASGVVRVELAVRAEAIISLKEQYYDMEADS